MKEFIDSIIPEDYHGVVYPLVERGHMVGQFDLSKNLLFYANPEKYPPVVLEPQVISKIVNPNQIKLL